eukprot:scaffold731_cov261-Pinguiococcus_pyrenoidosus.AAC.71
MDTCENLDLQNCCAHGHFTKCPAAHTRRTGGTSPGHGRRVAGRLGPVGWEPSIVARASLGPPAGCLETPARPWPVAPARAAPSWARHRQTAARALVPRLLGSFRRLFCLHPRLGALPLGVAATEAATADGPQEGLHTRMLLRRFHQAQRPCDLRTGQKLGNLFFVPFPIFVELHDGRHDEEPEGAPLSLREGNVSQRAQGQLQGLPVQKPGCFLLAGQHFISKGGERDSQDVLRLVKGAAKVLPWGSHATAIGLLRDSQQEQILILWRVLGRHGTSPVHMLARDPVWVSQRSRGTAHVVHVVDSELKTPQPQMCFGGGAKQRLSGDSTRRLTPEALELGTDSLDFVPIPDDQVGAELIFLQHDHR